MSSTNEAPETSTSTTPKARKEPTAAQRHAVAKRTAAALENIGGSLGSIHDVLCAIAEQGDQALTGALRSCGEENGSPTPAARIAAALEGWFAENGQPTPGARIADALEALAPASAKLGEQIAQAIVDTIPTPPENH